MKIFHILIFTLISTSFIPSKSHPQCLDYQPPYNPITPLKFCDKFSSYGCCTAQKDEELADRYKHVLTQKQNVNNKQIGTKCFNIIRDLICLQCHPYAAHIFDGERKHKEIFEKKVLHFPGLCISFCSEVFDECKDIFLQMTLTMTSTEKFQNFINQTNATEFCSWAKIPGEDYCYPNVNNFKDKQIKLEENYKNKLCVEPFPRRYFANALVAVHSNDKTHRLFVGEQRGLVFVILPDGTTLEKPFLDITHKIVNSGNPWDERGFLGLVFHPNYKANGRFYIYYSSLRTNNKGKGNKHKISWNTKHMTRISEMTVDPNNPNIADHSSEQPILEVDQPEPNHNGGMLMFGEDDYLYVFIGDGGGSGDQHGRYGNGQLMSTLLGKVLRIDVDVEDQPYGMPNNNPFVHSENTRSEIFAYGVRNPWRCSVDWGDKDGRNKGRIFCGDVGQNMYEEINIISKGKNYGWRAFEGFSCFDEKMCNETEIKNLEFPILVYNHTVGRSVVGGYVYRGCGNPNLYGKYIFADTMNGKLLVATEDKKKRSWSYEEIIIGDSSFCNKGLTNMHYHRNILSFGQSESGEIFILSAVYPHPRKKTSLMYRIIDPTKRGDPDTCSFTPEIPKALGNIKRREILKRP